MIGLVNFSEKPELNSTTSQTLKRTTNVQSASAHQVADVKEVEGSSDVDDLLAGLGLVRVRELDDLLTRRQKLGNA